MVKINASLDYMFKLFSTLIDVLSVSLGLRLTAAAPELTRLLGLLNGFCFACCFFCYVLFCFWRERVDRKHQEIVRYKDIYQLKILYFVVILLQNFTILYFAVILLQNFTD